METEKIKLMEPEQDSSTHIWKILVWILGGLCFLLGLVNKIMANRIIELEKDRLKLLTDNLRNSENFSSEVKNQIEKLIVNYQKKQPEVSVELQKVLRFIEAGEDIAAIKDLAKILENLLKTKYRTDEVFLAKKRGLSLKNLIDHAKEVCLLSKRQYNTACILHDFRNQESHELAVNDSDNMKIIGLLGGLEIVLIIDFTNHTVVEKY